MKGTFLHIKNMSIKQLCKCKARDFSMVLQAQNAFGVFEIWAPGMMKERSAHKVIHSVQKDNQHAEGIMTSMSDKLAKALSECLAQGERLGAISNRLSSLSSCAHAQRRSRGYEESCFLWPLSYSKSIKRYSCMIRSVWLKIPTLALGMTVNTVIRLSGRMGVVTATATDTDSVIGVRRI